jgi:hypothetical protein
MDLRFLPSVYLRRFSGEKQMASAVASKCVPKFPDPDSKFVSGIF